MKESNGLILRVYCSEQSRAPDSEKPLYEVLVEAAREADLAGATVFRAAMGYGAHHTLHTEKILQLSSDLPVVVEIIDRKESIEAFRESIRERVGVHCVTTTETTLGFPG